MFFLEFLFWCFATVAGAFVGGIFGRWKGGGEPTGWTKYMPRPIDQILCSAPFIAIAFFAFDVYMASVLSIITVAAAAKGHGRNMDLGTSDKTHPDAEHEWYEGLIGDLYGKMPNYWYDALGLAVSGLTVSIPVGLFLVGAENGGLLLGCILTASGVTKALGYMLGKLFTDLEPDVADLSEYDFYYEVASLRQATEWGEFFNWFFQWLVALPILFIVAGWLVI